MANALNEFPVSVDSPYYPYRRVYDYTNTPRAEELLSKLVNYLLDLPDAIYTPKDNNKLPRCRLNKLLYWDDADALNKPLPTPEQKMSLVFDPERPDRPPDPEKQYRIIPYAYPGQHVEYIGRTSLKIYLTYAKPMDDYRVEQAVSFEVLCNDALEGNVHQNVLSRSYDIANDIKNALHGVNMEGVGAWYYDRRQNTYCGLEPIYDKSLNVGYILTMGVTLMGGEAIEP